MENENNEFLIVCDRCLIAIESHEGYQMCQRIYISEDEPCQCEWCGEEIADDYMYKI